MQANISLFPVLTEDLLNKIRVQVSPYELYYESDGEIFPLKTEVVDGKIGTYNLTDEEGIWSPNEYNICIRRSYSISSFQCLFGENGIACKNAKIGVALMWTSSDSKQRGVIPIGEIESEQKSFQEKVDYRFNIAQLRGDVEFLTILYIKDEGTPLDDEKHLANRYGCVLGEIDSTFTISLDGSGSAFPIYELPEPGQPLWSVRCEWDDPTYDLFEECVAIKINTAHKNYRYLDKKSKSFDEQLLKEIMASALVIIIAKIKEQEVYWEETTKGDALQEGSVSEAVNYFVNTLEWDVSGLEETSISIRKFLDKRM